MKAIWVMVLCLVSTVLSADPAALNSLLQRYQDLQANFSETLIDQQGNRTTATGMLYIQKPNQFRWETQTPNQQLFVSNGKQVWNVEPDLEQVTITPLQENLSTTPLMLLSGQITNLSVVFRVVQVYATYYQLTPKTKDSMIKNMFIGFDQNGIVNFLQIDNTLGQVSQVTLTNVKVNQKLSPGLFTYQPAKGMSVLNSQS